MKTYNSIRGNTVNLTAAMLQNLATVPVTLFSVPLPDKYVIPLQIFYSYKFGTVAYTGTVSITADTTGQVLNNLASIDITRPNDFAGYLGAPEYASALLANSPLTLIANGTMGSGDGTLSVTLFYVLGN